MYNQLREFIELSAAELKSKIADMNPDELLNDDWVDTETGEVVLLKGKPAKSSMLHPQHSTTIKRQKFGVDEKGEEETDSTEVEHKLSNAIDEFVADWQDEKADESIAMDAAEGFFYSYYPQWKQWARVLGMNKRDIKMMVAEAIYEIMNHN